MVAVLLIGGIGFTIGYMTGDDDGADSANASSSQVTPNGGRSNGNGGGVPNGNGNGQTAAPIAFLGVELGAAADNGGARISSVREDSPAADAGLESGDVVTKIDDTTVADDDDLIRAIRAHDPGDDVTVTYPATATPRRRRSRSAIVRRRPAVQSPSHPDPERPAFAAGTRVLLTGEGRGHDDHTSHGDGTPVPVTPRRASSVVVEVGAVVVVGPSGQSTRIVADAEAGPSGPKTTEPVIVEPSTRLPIPPAAHRRVLPRPPCGHRRSARQR